MRPVLIALMGLLPLGAAAQTPTAAELAAMVDERAGAVNEYVVLLRDPDPVRAMAAMQIMIGLDDPELRRMALNEGLYSTNTAMRRAALQAFFDSSPTLFVTFDVAGSSDAEQAAQAINGMSGSVGTDGEGFAVFPVGPYNPERGCWTHTSNTNNCIARLSETSLSVLFYGDWGEAVVDADGSATGTIKLNRADAVTFSFPISL